MRFREIQYLPKVTPSLTQPTRLAKFQSQLSYYVLINNCFLRSPGYIQHRTLLLRNTRKSILLSCPIAALNQRLALLLRQSNSEPTLHPDSQSCPMGSAPLTHLDGCFLLLCITLSLSDGISWDHLPNRYLQANPGIKASLWGSPNPDHALHHIRVSTLFLSGTSEQAFLILEFHITFICHEILLFFPSFQ